MTNFIPIPTINLFPELDDLLIDLLRSLSLSDWEKTTIVPSWTIKDIAVHLLDGNIRTLSILRDQYMGDKPDNINSYQDLVAYLDKLNADWVKAMKRVSPAILIELLASTGQQYYEYLSRLEAFEKATFSVAWAGEQESYNWFHIAREFTEKWHHQQQIRLALGQEQALYTQHLYYPYLATSMQALPFHYRNVQANEGELIVFTVTGKGGGNWLLSYNDTAWKLVENSYLQESCKVIIPEDIAWRIFTKGIKKEEALQKATITGNIHLGDKIFEMLAIMG